MLKNGFFTFAKATLAHWQNQALPGFCVLCTAKSDHSLCPSCIEYLQVRCKQEPEHCCDICDLPLARQQPSTKEIPPSFQICRECIKQQPNYDIAITGLRYQFPASDLINQLKHQRAFHWLPHLAEPLLERIARSYHNTQELPDVLCPVPSHWIHFLKRGYNQSAIITQHLSKELSIPIKSPLRKTHKTLSQQGLSRKQRLRNLNTTFHCTTDIVEGKHVALVDDVLTTGATADTLAKLLKNKGAQQVDVWALARTPKG